MASLLDCRAPLGADVTHNRKKYTWSSSNMVISIPVVTVCDVIVKII